MARTACLSGDYTRGITLLSELFVATKDPNYIFNQGRCFEQNSRYEEAISRFREYLRKVTDISPSDKADAEKHISDCQDLLVRQTPQPAVAAAPASAVPSPQEVPAMQAPVTPTPIAVAAPSIVQSASPQAAGEPGSGLRTAGIITASVGGAALVAGIILNLKVNSMASDFQNLNGYTDSKESDRKTYETLGWTSYGVGGACVATGAVLYYLGVKAGKNGFSSVALLPALAPGGAFAVVKGAF